MKLLALLDKKSVRDFLVLAGENSGAEFLASLEWAEIIKSEGEQAESLGVYNDEQELIAILNLIKTRSFYYYSPRGPIFKLGLSLEEQNKIWQFLKIYFKKQKAIFWRVEPKSELPDSLIFKKTKNLQPQETLMLDLNLSEDDLLTSFHPKTRYNIRLAEKKGVYIYEGTEAKDFDSFWELMTETGERDSFKIHNKKHYQTLATANPEFIKLFLAEINGKIIAAGLFSFYGDKVTYLHGASSHQDRQLMAPYLLQWHLIKLAKAGNYKYYDFYGIDEEKWPGVTRFKLGFSGFRVSYTGTYDLILNQAKYYFYNLLRRVKNFL